MKDCDAHPLHVGLTLASAVLIAYTFVGSVKTGNTGIPQGDDLATICLVVLQKILSSSKWYREQNIYG